MMISRSINKENLTHDSFLKEVEEYEKELTEEYDDMPAIYKDWCGFLNDLVLMPQCCDDPDKSRVDLREYHAVRNIFTKLSGMDKDSFLSISFFMFYRGWLDGHSAGYRQCKKSVNNAAE